MAEQLSEYLDTQNLGVVWRHNLAKYLLYIDKSSEPTAKLGLRQQSFNINKTMRAFEIISESKPTNLTGTSKLWTAPITIRQPNYNGRIDVTVAALNITQARQLIKAQYGIKDWDIGSIKEVK